MLKRESTFEGPRPFPDERDACITKYNIDGKFPDQYLSPSPPLLPKMQSLMHQCQTLFVFCTQSELSRFNPIPKNRPPLPPSPHEAHSAPFLIFEGVFTQTSVIYFPGKRGEKLILCSLVCVRVRSKQLARWHGGGGGKGGSNLKWREILKKVPHICCI